MNEEIERMIVEHAHAEDIQKAAVADGMVPLRQAGLIAVAGGTTSLEEVLTRHRLKARFAEPR